MSADRLREPMSLLRHLWTATGYDSEIRVCDLFSDDDPIRFDIEAVLGEDEARSLSREGLRERVTAYVRAWEKETPILIEDMMRDLAAALSSPLDPSLSRDRPPSLAEQVAWNAGYRAGAALSSPPDPAVSEGLREALAGLVRRVNDLMRHPNDPAMRGDLDGYTDAIAAQYLSSPAQEQGAET